MGANMQLTINSFRQLFPDKIFSLTLPWLLVKSATFPWQLSNSPTFPGFPDKWSPRVIYSKSCYYFKPGQLTVDNYNTIWHQTVLQENNLCRGHNLKLKWSRIQIQISGLIWNRIHMSARSLPKCSGFILLSASVTLPCIVKIGWWSYEKY